MLARPFAVVAAIASLAIPAVATAQNIPQFYSARAVGFGGARSLASGPEAIWLNPAALGFLSQYVIQLDYGHDQGASEDLATANGLVVSLVDSRTNATIPVGLSFRYVWLTENGAKVQGSVYDFSIAAKLFGSVAAGLHLQYLSYTGVQHVTGDAGVLVPFGPISVNFTAFNLIKVNSPDAPIGGDVGAALGDGKVYRVGFDFARQWPVGQSPQDLYNVGAEVFIASMFAIRAGSLWNTIHPSFWPPTYLTAGAGFYVSIVGFDASYQRNLLTGENSWVFGVKVYPGSSN